VEKEEDFGLEFVNEKGEKDNKKMNLKDFLVNRKETYN
jgi:hypothetical protein